LFLIVCSAFAEPVGDLHSDSWVAIDGAGRVLPGYEQVGPPRNNRTVGIFYWTWLAHHMGATGDRVYDITQIIAANPQNPAFGPFGMPHHWGMPEQGYYSSTDPFVLRKHATLLSAAGVDVLLFDTTNPPFTFKESYMALCEVFSRMQSEGNTVPQIAFICPFGNPLPVLETIYGDLYKPGLYEPLWFRWKGKPLVLADPAFVSNPEMKEFFTFRRPMPTYFDGPTGPDQWGWLEVFPQHAFYGSDPNAIEQVTVGVAQNAVHQKLGPMSHNDGAYGRSWHQGKKDPAPDAVLYGYNFQEQFDHALKIDPPFIFITGWNEWVAGRFKEWAGYTGRNSEYPDALFVDQYSQEYSRDIEPMQGGHTDNYYYQMVANIRRYKGVRKPQPSTAAKTIAIDGCFEDWNGVGPEYRDAVGDTVHRDHLGFGRIRYTNTTGRNDLALMKVARDAENVYFYARTADPLTPQTDKDWMLLFIDIDADASTGWEGYDYVVNLDVFEENTTSLHRLTQGWDPQPVAKIPLAVAGNHLELAIRRELLGLTADSEIVLHFKWADNIQKHGDIVEFSIHGDAAPERRFNYRYATYIK
jgi:hypothetical protein